MGMGMLQSDSVGSRDNTIYLELRSDLRQIGLVWAFYFPC